MWVEIEIDIIISTSHQPTGLLLRLTTDEL